jgi:hypothetical protein
MIKLTEYQKKLSEDIAFDAKQDRDEYEDDLPSESIAWWILQKWPTDQMAKREYLHRHRYEPDIIGPAILNSDRLLLKEKNRKKSKSTKPKRKTCRCK